jgi:hypothetical protein
MASVLVGRDGAARTGDRLLSCAAEHGSAAHPYPTSDELLRGPSAARNLSDAVHFLCALHGRHPGVVDHAANRSVDPLTRSWFGPALEAFSAERAFLARLAVAAGPMPSTAGAGDNQAAVLGQRHAIEMLARSERDGCALGAALAVVVDWAAVRNVLETAGRRFGVEVPHYRYNDTDTIRDLVDDVATTIAMERALLFGCEQIVIQHFGLWDLLEARQQARGN